MGGEKFMFQLAYQAHVVVDQLCNSIIYTMRSGGSTVPALRSNSQIYRHKSLSTLCGSTAPACFVGKSARIVVGVSQANRRDLLSEYYIAVQCQRSCDVQVRISNGTNYYRRVVWQYYQNNQTYRPN